MWRTEMLRQARSILPCVYRVWYSGALDPFLSGLSSGALEMLLEIRNVEQVPGEPRRRWFFSHEQDLLIWFGDDGAPVAFQLSYGKYRDEHAIRWKAGRGFTHHRVDDGEGGALRRDAPLLMTDGALDASRVMRRFRELSAEMPPEIVDFVVARLQEHPEYREDS